MISSLLVFYNKDTIYFGICQMISKVKVKVLGEHPQVEEVVTDLAEAPHHQI
jgi:hypothetical protein